MAGGKKAKQQGELGEQLFEGSCSIYRANGLLSFTKTYPEFIPLRRLKNGHIQGFYKSKAEADYILTTRDYGTCWVEIKLFSAKNKKTYSLSLHQFEFLQEQKSLGCFCCYLILWQYNQSEAWTLHPIGEIPVKPRDNGYSLIFNRNEGLQVDSSIDGQPYFLPVISQWLAR